MKITINQQQKPIPLSEMPVGIPYVYDTNKFCSYTTLNIVVERATRNSPGQILHFYEGENGVISIDPYAWTDNSQCIPVTIKNIELESL